MNVTLIIPTTFVSLCRDLCTVLAGPSGDGMFLRHVGDGEAATHRISHGVIRQDFIDLLPITSIDSEGNIVRTEGNVEAIVYAASQAGYTTTVEDVQVMLNTADISYQEPVEALQRLGLQLMDDMDFS